MELEKIKSLSDEDLSRKISKLTDMRNEFLDPKYDDDNYAADDFAEEAWLQGIPEEYREDFKKLSKLEGELRACLLEKDRRQRIFFREKTDANFEIKHDNTDLLDYRRYSKKLSEKIKKFSNHIGIMGDWGTGKSFLLDLIEKELAEEELSTKIPVIRINASSVETDETIWYTLLSRVSDFYSPKYSVKKNIRYIWKSIGKKGGWIKILPVFFLIVFIGALSVFISKRITILSTFITFISGILSISTFSNLFSTVKEIGFIDKHFFTKFNYPNYKELLEEKEKIKTELETFIELIIKDSKSDKVVIMIDELDRCDREKLMNFFTSIETFIHLENVVFIFSINPRILLKRVGEKEDTLDLNYLEKYFNVSFPMPNDIDYKLFIKGKCFNWGDEETQNSMTQLINLVNEYDKVTPRKLNSILNFISFYRQDYKQLTLKEFSNLVILLTFLDKDVVNYYKKFQYENKLTSQNNSFSTISKYDSSIRPEYEFEYQFYMMIRQFELNNETLSPKLVIDMSESILKLLPKNLIN